MNSIHILFANALLLGTAFLTIDAQSYPYEVTLAIGVRGSNWSQSGKMNLTLIGNNFRQTYNLSGNTFDDFNSHRYNTYIINARYKLLQIKQVGLFWTKKVSTLLSPKIHVRRVTLTSFPVNRSYCPSKGDELIPAETLVLMKPCP